MDYLKKVTENREPSKADKLLYNTLWIFPFREGLRQLFIQKNKNPQKPQWEPLGYEITQHIEEFWRDDDSFVKQATFLFDLNEEEVAELKARMPHNH